MSSNYQSPSSYQCGVNTSNEKQPFSFGKPQATKEIFDTPSGSHSSRCKRANHLPFKQPLHTLAKHHSNTDRAYNDKSSDRRKMETQNHELNLERHLNPNTISSDRERLSHKRRGGRVYNQQEMEKCINEYIPREHSEDDSYESLSDADTPLHTNKHDDQEMTEDDFADKLRKKIEEKRRRNALKWTEHDLDQFVDDLFPKQE